MKILICLDYSNYTEKVLEAARMLLATRIPPPEIRVIHIIDQSLISVASEKDQSAVIRDLRINSMKVYDLAKLHLGQGFEFIEETGIPQGEIDKILQDVRHDLVVVGTRGRSVLANVLMGSVAEHLLHTAKQPLLIVP